MGYGRQSKLSDAARTILEDHSNQFYVSSASVWEVSIKHTARPNDIPVTAEQMVRFCRNSGIVELTVGFDHSMKLSELPQYHSDPFDRMLLVQAQTEGMLFMSHDHKLPPYGDFVVQV